MRVSDSVEPSSETMAGPGERPVVPDEHVTPIAPKNTVAQETFAVLSMLAIFGWIWVGPVIVVASVWYVIVWGSKIGLTCLVLIGSTALLPAHPYWPAFVHNQVWDCWRRYFEYSHVTPELPFLDPDKNYLFVHFPHGSFPMGSWLSLGATKAKDAGMPTRVYSFAATVLLHLPVVRQLMSWMGVVSADKQTMLDVLSQGCGGALPEGIAGIFTGAARSKERIYLSKRKGFVKVALQAGADIVPIYVLGQSQVFVYKGSEALSRKFRVAIGFFYGRFYSPLPNKVRLTIVAGRPIVAKKTENPSTEQVVEVHAQVVEAVKSLYYKHRHLHNWQDRELEIV